MKNLLQNKNSIKNFVYSLGVLSFVALGGVVAYLGTNSQEGTLSKFTQPSKVTTQTVSTLWTPSTENPHRVKLQTFGHAARTDAIIAVMLKKGLTLDKATFSTYLRNLQVGITTMANEPMFKSDAEIQEIAQYIAFEITDTTNVLNGRDAFFQRLNDLVNGVQEVTTNSGSTSTGASSTGTADDLLNDLANLIQGVNPTIVTTTTTSTGTTTTTSGTGTGNVSDALLNDLATLINGSSTGTGTQTTETTQSTSTGTTTSTPATGTTNDLMNDLGNLINGTSSDATTTSPSTDSSTTSTTPATTTSTTPATTTTTPTTTTNSDAGNALIDDLLRLING